VAVALRLPDVVQEHAQHQELRLLDLGEDMRRALGLGRLPGRDRLQVLDGEQGMLIGREAVIDVVLHEAREGPELRKIGAEQPQLVHLGQRERHATPVPADVEEQIAHGGRAPEAVVDQVERVLDRALEVQRQLAPEAMEVPEHLHDPGGIAAQQPGVAVREVEPTVEEDEAVRERLLPLAPLRRPTP
jgi:hypothetical protein